MRMTLKKRLSLYRKGHLGQVRYAKLQAAGIDKRNILLASRHRLGSNLKITPSGNDLGDGSRYLTCGTAFSRAQTDHLGWLGARSQTSGRKQ
jgi:hypothetical protein